MLQYYALSELKNVRSYEMGPDPKFTLGWFNKNFIHNGLIDIKFGIIIRKAANRRTKSDYESFVEYDKVVILEMFDEMKEFISEIEIFLNKK